MSTDLKAWLDSFMPVCFPLVLLTVIVFNLKMVSSLINALKVDNNHFSDCLKSHFWVFIIDLIFVGMFICSLL